MYRYETLYASIAASVIDITGTIFPSPGALNSIIFDILTQVLMPLFLLPRATRSSVRRFVHHIFWFLCICWQITWKEWHNIWHADVSRWFTLGRHRCRWVLWSFRTFIRPPHGPWAWAWVLQTNRLEDITYNLTCSCIQVTYARVPSTSMGIIVCLSFRPIIQVWVCWVGIGEAEGAVIVWMRLLKNTAWILLRFGTHVGNGSARNWLTFQDYKSRWQNYQNWHFCHLLNNNI